MILQSEPRPRVGIVGTGGISRSHARGWRALHADIHVFSSQGAEDFAAQFAPVTIHDSFESLLGAVDVIDVCIPTPSHPEYVHAALDHGTHVLCEKPLALSSGEAARMAEHAREAGLLLSPHTSCGSSPNMRRFAVPSTLATSASSPCFASSAPVRCPRSPGSPTNPSAAASSWTR